MRIRYTALLLALALHVPVLAQDGPPDLPTERYNALTGLYAFPDGQLLEIFDLVDQMRRHQLTTVQFGNGRVRSLVPTSPTTFTAGPAWFVDEPVTFTLTFTDGPDGIPTSVDWAQDGTPRTGQRVAFEERPVTFENGDITIAGQLILPPSGHGFEAPHPAMLMIHGSGPLTRRGQRYVAELFAYHGIAVLVHDKRGTGGSTGSWNALAHRAWADDIRAGVDTLRAQPDIDPGRVGLFAASEGGYIAPQLIASDSSLAFLVCRVCASLPHGEVILDMEGGAMRRNGYTDEQVEAGVAYLRLQIANALEADPSNQEAMRDLLAANEDAPWVSAYNLELRDPAAPFWATYRGVLEPDPGPLYEQAGLPILIVLGEADNRILAAPNVARYEAIRAASGHPDFTVRVLPNATHGLLEVPSTPDGQPGPFDRYVPGFHLDLVRWVQARVGLADHPQALPPSQDD